LVETACAGLRKGETANLCAVVEKLRLPLRAFTARVRDCCMTGMGVHWGTGYYYTRRGEQQQRREKQDVGEKCGRQADGRF
jgi:hypothetical protein